MRLLAFNKNGQDVLGVRQDDRVIDLSVAAPQLPGSLRGLLDAGDSAFGAIVKAVDKAPTDAVVDASSITHAIPLPNPSKIFCLGLNYADHAKEGGSDAPDYPAIFMRGPSSLVAHNQPIIRPLVSDTLDYEAELMAVIGKRCRNVSKADALSVVAGYSCFNDGSVREYQRKASQWTMGKNFDATGGFGPEFVTADELPPGCVGLSIRSILDGRVMQDDNTDNMLCDMATTIELLTECVTLEPGDLIAMGTPAGVGYPRKPPVFMRDGATCQIEIEGVGTLSNPVKDAAE